MKEKWADVWSTHFFIVPLQTDKSINEQEKTMINRELIRTKVVQLTYAYYQNGSKNIETAEKELIFSLSKAYDLYNYMLALIVGITRESRRHLEVAESRAKREGTPMPSRKFADNRFALQPGREQDASGLHGNPEDNVERRTGVSEKDIHPDYRVRHLQRVHGRERG